MDRNGTYSMFQLAGGRFPV